MNFRTKSISKSFYLSPFGNTSLYTLIYICAVKGIFYILLFYLLGCIISSLSGGVVSGNVIGMVLLFAALSLKIIRPQTVKAPSKFLLDHMAMLFIPPGVGILVSYSIISQHLWAIILAAGISTVIVIAAVGWIQQILGRKL